MTLVPLSQLFDIEYGNQFDLNKMSQINGDINFVSRTSENLGVVAKVVRFQEIEPYPAGLITVTLGGTYLLSSFVQQAKFYTAQNIKVLTPKSEMSLEEKIFYCLAISRNRFKYTSHGREANVTLDTLPVPDSMPANYKQSVHGKLNSLNPTPLINDRRSISTRGWEYFSLVDLFEISASKDELVEKLTPGGKTPYVTSSDRNNGITSLIEEPPTNSAGTITANRGGSVGFFFYQPEPYQATPVDVRILTPKFPINQYVGLFLKTVLQLERHRFNYSRKMGSDRLAHLRIKLPTNRNKPDWEFMESYIKSLPYSASIQG